MEHFWHHDRYETSHLRASAHGRRAQPSGGRAALAPGVCPPPLPDSVGERARRESPPTIARAIGGDDQTGRTVVRRFEQDGLDACLTRRSNRPQQPATKVDRAAAENLRALLHQSPRRFGKPTGVWSLQAAAEVSFATGVTPERVSDETIRRALGRLGVDWKRAKHGITSPDPAYARKKDDATA